MTEAQPAEERSYIAFISYRHKELDREAAVRIQKKIENYVVPKEYRSKAGGKKLGVVFRDEDELPASSSLSDSITYALDHTQYLIVICTPDLPLSKWCLQEVSYFLKTHDRDHVLAVLVDGTPEESFPAQLRFTYDDEGRELAEVEPLAANIAGEGHTINKKAFHKETTRLIAAMLGCPFDALWQRERRAKTNRLIAAMGVGVAAMAVVMGIVLSKNAQISRQNDQILEQNDQIKQQNDQISDQNTRLQQQMSSVLVDSGLAQLEQYDRSAALKSALSALESGDPAIYDHRAEALLADALGAYSVQDIECSLLCEQNTAITQLAAMADGRILLTADAFATVRAFDTETGSLRWQVPLLTWDSLRMYPVNAHGLVICKTYDRCIALSVEDGSTVWSFSYKKSSAFQVLSEDESIFAVMDRGLELGGATGAALYFLDTQNGSVLREIVLPCDGFQVRPDEKYDYFYEYAGDFSADKTWFACVLPVVSDAESSAENSVLFSADLTDGSIQRIGSFAKQPEMILSLVCHESANAVYSASVLNHHLYSMIFPMDLSADITVNDYDYSLASPSGFSYHDYNYQELPYLPPLNDSELSIVFSRNVIYLMDMRTGTMRNTINFDSAIVCAEWIDPEEEIFQVFTESGKCVQYDVSHYDNKAIESLQSSNTPVRSVQKAALIRKGPVADRQDGLLALTRTDAPGQLILSKTASDTGLHELDGWDLCTDTACITLSPSGKRLMVFSKKDPGSTLWKVCDLSTGEWTQETVLPFFPLTGVYLGEIQVPDDDHAICGGTIYGLDGSAEKIDIDFPYRFDDARPSARLQTDGSVLSCCESGAEYDGQRYAKISVLSCKQNGVLLAETENVESGLAVANDDAKEHPYLYSAGKNGWIGAWGNLVYVNEDGELMATGDPKVAVMDLHTKEKFILEGTQPDVPVDNLIFSNTRPLLSIIYKNGDVQLFDLSNGCRSVLSTSTYEYGELHCIAFSDQDNYLMLFTEMNQLDCYDTASGKLVFSQGEVFREKGSSNFGSLYAAEDPDNKRMVVWIDYLFRSDKTAFIMDTDAWVKTASIGKFLGFSKAEQVFIVGTGTPFFTCPYYSVDDLAKQANDRLN